MIEKAFTLAQRLDNPIFQANAASGLAMVAGRLGDHSDQVKWARRAITVAPDAEWGIPLLGATYELASGLALQDRAVEATGVLAEMTDRFTGPRPPWMTQAWLLIKADVYAIVGDKARARRSATSALSQGQNTVLHECFVGPLARWLALISKGSEDEAIARDHLAKLRETIDRFDAKDQAEILAAELYLGGDGRGDRLQFATT